MREKTHIITHSTNTSCIFQEKDLVNCKFLTHQILHKVCTDMQQNQKEKKKPTQQHTQAKTFCWQNATQFEQH